MCANPIYRIDTKINLCNGIQNQNYDTNAHTMAFAINFILECTILLFG